MLEFALILLHVSAKYKYDQFWQKLRSVNYGASKEVIEEAERLKKTRWSHFREQIASKKRQSDLTSEREEMQNYVFLRKDIQIKENLIIMEIGSEWIIAGLANLW